MKKLDSHQSKRYGPLVMWLNDLNELFSIFSKLQSFEGFEFIVDNTKFDTIEEFTQEYQGRDPHEIQVRIYKDNSIKPLVDIHLSPNYTGLSILSNDLIISGLFREIDLILSRCQRKPFWFFDNSFCFKFALFWFVACSVLSTFPYIFLGLTPFKIYLNNIFWFVLPFLCIWLLFTTHMHFKKLAVIHSMSREMRPSFIKRKKDDIFLALICIIAGTIITKVVDNLF